MKQILRLTTFSLVLSTLLIGCGSDDNNSNKNGNNQRNLEEQGSNSEHDDKSSFDINSYSISKLTPELKNAIAYMGNEERLAYDVYHNLYDYHLTNSATEIKQLKNISEKSEIKHVGIVQDIVKKYQLNPEDVTNVIDPVATRDIAFEEMPSGKYDIPAIQTLYDVLYDKGVVSSKDALEVGCMVEVTDIDDLDKYLTMATESSATDIVEAFNILRDGSYNHYWAFDKGLKNMGITDGCCSLGTIGEVNYCHNEYPQNEHEHEGEESSNSQGNGEGEGNSNAQGSGEGEGSSNAQGSGEGQGSGNGQGNGEGQGSANGQGHGKN